MQNSICPTLVIENALANQSSQANAASETLPWTIGQKGRSRDLYAGPRDRSKSRYPTWDPWAAGAQYR